MIEIKCKKCRNTLLNEKQSSDLLVTAHNIPLNDSSENLCETNEAYFFLREEDLVDWVRTPVETGEWSKGRINCPHCKSKLGCFDFISGKKCGCSGNILPPIHIIKSKVDAVKKLI